MTNSDIIRLEPNGPAGKGLEAWPPIAPSDLVSGTPVQHGHTYLDDKVTGLSVGVWSCTAFTTTMAPYSVNEFMVVLEGTVTIIDAKGSETKINAGESFLIPKGLVCQWKQIGFVRKFFVIFEDASGRKPKDAAGLKILKLDPKARLAACDGPDPALVIGDTAPTWHDTQVFADATGQFSVGVWDTTPYQRQPITFARHELMHIIEGAVTLTGGDGRAQTFKAGDTLFVPLGASMAWSSTHYVRKFYCTFKPAVAVAQRAAGE